MLTANVPTLIFVLCLANFAVGEVCYVCGTKEEIISNPNSILSIPIEYDSPIGEVDCETLALAGMSGLISEETCSDLHDSLDFKLFCGCGSGETNDVPTKFPIMYASPSFAPTVTQETNDPNVSVPVQSNSEETELPSTEAALDNGEGNDDVPDVKSSDQPSGSPSDVPSASPSDVPSSLPSDVPSDVPSVQPTVDRDVSGVVAESSATTASFVTLAQILPTVVATGLVITRLF